MVDYISYSGLSDPGWKKTENEDFIWFNDRDFGNDMMFAAVADGSGSAKDSFRPSSIAVHQIDTMLQRFYKKDPQYFRDKARTILEMSVLSANDVLTAFKLGDESERYGYATTITCVLIARDGTMAGAHAGNTRLYLLRDQNTIQLTKDHTKAQQMIDTGEMDPARAFMSVEKLVLNSGLGMYPNPDIQTFQLKLKENDFLIMTSDGIHYSYPDDQFLPLILDSKDLDEAAKRFVSTAKDVKTYNDNISVSLMWYLGANPAQTAEEGGAK